ncbi:MAG: prepilin-type N-terminal cleavage/methylation domain-containing protein [Myxococcaceae bacterium]|nr:prepilin-type N-terminal cleavage/methylation domain-containing protein [Myxococcaceae bacterium]
MTLRRRGLTMIELLVVVALVGIIASMSVYTLSAVNDRAKVNGAAETVATVLRNARVQAITERCTYVVQINGPTYNPTTAPADVPRTPGSVLVWRKNNCNSTVGAYEANIPLPQRDRRVADYNLTEFNVELALPAGLVTGNVLLNDSVSIAYQPNGQRLIFVDDDVDGASTASGLGGQLDLTTRPHNKPNGPTRVVQVPAAAAAVAP